MSDTSLTNEQIAAAFQQRIGAGQVQHRLFERTARAGDASIYRLLPRVVVSPRNAEDVWAILDYCREAGLYLTFRAAGTSLSGQAVTDGVLVDVAAHWKGLRILDGGRRVAVEPGVVGAHVNAFLAPHRAKIGPDPASINACMMGGIAANNASGMCCGVQYNSYHTLASMKLMLANGWSVDTAEPGAAARFAREQPEITAGLATLRDEICKRADIVETLRRKFSIKNTCGYSMNAFVDYTEPLDILAHLLIGSEGTLGFISEITLNTLPDKPLKATALVFFRSLIEAGASIKPLADSGAAVLEIMDRAAMKSVADEMNYPFELQGNCAALLIEFQEDDETGLKQRLDTAHGILGRYELLAPVDFTRDPALQAAFWHMRKGLFPSVGAMREMGTAVIIEDVCVQPADLANLIQDLQQMFGRHGFDDAIIFGHAKDGNVHFVICTDFSQEEQTRRYAGLMDELTSTVSGKYGGSLKAEHGTGRNIAPFVEQEWGPEIYEMMWRVKR
ncbi:MAG: FAD-binding oxidoreductase, partial [Candidatus Sumerlaeaceae bacterium]|nr:FAD-binding oxidoreductase [Candidatus Sumerlaeaceae bacterium]